jgi:hypothetical protein
VKRILMTTAIGAALTQFGWAGGALAQASPSPSPSLVEAIAAGHPLLEIRAREETVDQTKTAVLTETAQALTVRTRAGWETAAWHSLQGLVEVANVSHLGAEHFAVNVPGSATPPLNGADKVKYPLVNDPSVTELNRLQLTWTPNAALQVTAGRQRVLIDDQRFIGNVGWRQDEQTFDAVRADFKWGQIKGVYAYVTHVNRVLGDQRDWHSDSHLANLAWSPAELFRLEGFVYALDFRNSAANSSVTEGLRASGKARAGVYQFAYDATLARQGDYRANTPAYRLGYWQAAASATRDVYNVRADYEVLEGNGTRGFTTPLATTHGFQGWADAWVQPLGGNKGFVDGLKDFNLAFDAKPKAAFGPFTKPDFFVRYHEFWDQRTGARLAHEWDAQVQAALTGKLTAALKYADFQRETQVPAGTAAPPASRTKVWLTLEFKL